MKSWFQHPGMQINNNTANCFNLLLMKTNLREKKKLYYTFQVRYYLSSRGTKSKTQLLGTSRQELKQKQQRNATYWLSPSSLINCLSYTAQAYLPTIAPPTVSWDPYINQQPRKFSTDITTCQSNRGNCLTEVASSQLCQVDKQD